MSRFLGRGAARASLERHPGCHQMATTKVGVAGADAGAAALQNRGSLRRSSASRYVRPGLQSCSSMPTLGCSCSPRSADSKRSQCRGMGCVKAIALLEPGPSFCWGPALEGPTSPSSTRSSMPGKVDEIDTPGAPLVRPPPCKRLSHPARPTHRFRRLAPHTLRLHASQPPHLHCAIVCAGAQLCPLT